MSAQQEYYVEFIEAIFFGSVPATADEINENVIILCDKIFNEIYKCSKNMTCVDFISKF